MSISKTTKGYTLRWYDVGGRERQRTYKGVTRDEARTHRARHPGRARSRREPPG